MRVGSIGEIIAGRTVQSRDGTIMMIAEAVGTSLVRLLLY